jgi:capsular exopolysaccharide synthesis family protein
MELRDYVHVLRARWRVIIAITLLCVLLATAFVLTTPKAYEARAKVFVSVTATSKTDPANAAYAGSQFALQRMKSYTELSDSVQVLQPVLLQLKLSESVAELSQKTTVVNPASTVVLDVTATDGDALRAADIANAMADSLSSTIQKLEAGDSGNPGYVQVVVTTRAVTPKSPVAPQVMLNIGLGLIVGLMLGFAIAVIRERLDTSIRSMATLHDLTGKQPIARIPPVARASLAPVVTLNDSGAAAAEAYRSVRTALMLGTGNRNGGGLPDRVIVTSAGMAEGRTMVALNLAIAAANAGARVCLVEADLRRPRLAEYLGVPVIVGLNAVLSGHRGLDDAVFHWRDTISVIAAGPVTREPGSLLASPLLGETLDELSKRFDMLVIDTPALGAVADALVIAQACDGDRDAALVLARRGRTTEADVRAALESLRSVDATILGTVMTVIPGRRRRRRKATYDAIDLADIGTTHARVKKVKKVRRKAKSA